MYLTAPHFKVISTRYAFDIIADFFFIYIGAQQNPTSLCVREREIERERQR